jgi:hypothetical protein
MLKMEFISFYILNLSIGQVVLLRLFAADSCRASAICNRRGGNSMLQNRRISSSFLFPSRNVEAVGAPAGVRIDWRRRSGVNEDERMVLGGDGRRRDKGRAASGAADVAPHRKIQSPGPALPGYGAPLGQGRRLPCSAVATPMPMRP